jgi:hypothetical protein
VVGGISIKSVRIKLGRCPSKPLHPDLHPKGAQVGSQHTSLSKGPIEEMPSDIRCINASRSQYHTQQGNN